MPWRTIFFWVNLAACLVCIGLVMSAILEGGSFDAQSGMIGLILASPAIVIAVAEVLLFSRRMPWLERPLGVVAGAVAALACFAFISNALEPDKGRGSPGLRFWLGFGLICFTIAAYCLLCCWLRVRRQTLPPSPAFPINPPGISGQTK